LEGFFGGKGFPRKFGTTYYWFPKGPLGGTQGLRIGVEDLFGTPISLKLILKLLKKGGQRLALEEGYGRAYEH